MRTVKECCGDRCKWADYPVARIMLCGREITNGESDRAKAAWLRERGEARDGRDGSGERK